MFALAADLNDDSVEYSVQIVSVWLETSMKEAGLYTHQFSRKLHKGEDILKIQKLFTKEDHIIRKPTV
jgi:hypothetical protein